jgi:hypothetical protein
MEAGVRGRDARKWKILMFNQLLMSEFNVVTPWRSFSLHFFVFDFFVLRAISSENRQKSAGPGQTREGKFNFSISHRVYEA